MLAREVADRTQTTEQVADRPTRMLQILETEGKMAKATQMAELRTTWISEEFRQINQ